MKAVIMAGGEGKRLRPLTCGLPKPMMPVLNRPVMEYIIEQLKVIGITEIAVTTFYLPETIKDHFGSGQDRGVKLYYFEETSPMGTAGSINNARDFLDESFIVLSGDALFDFDLRQGINFHQTKKTQGTVLLTEVDNPLPYGVVLTDSQDRIIRFIEKPDWGQVFSNKVNTGIYILEPEILDYIPGGVSFDFSKDLFPLLLKRGQDLFALELKGYWKDIGKFEDYQRIQYDWLEGKINLPLQGYKNLGNQVWVQGDVEIDSSARLIGPLLIGDGSRIEKNVYLEKTILGEKNTIRENSSLKRCILWNYNYLGHNCELRGSILSSNVVLKERVNVFDRTVLGSKVTTGRNSIINSGVKIWPKKQIEENTRVNSDLIWPHSWSNQLFTNGEVAGTANLDVTPQFVSRLAGAYAAILKKGENVAVSADSYKISNALKNSMTAGLQTNGINVIDLGETVTPVLRYSITKLRASGGVHLRLSNHDPEKVVIEFLNEKGIQLSTAKQKQIEKKFFTEDIKWVSPAAVGNFAFAPGMSRSYLEGIVAHIDSQIIKRNYFSLVVDYEYDNLLELLPVFLEKLNCQILSTRNYSTKNQPLSIEERLQARDKVARIMQQNKADLGLIIDHNAEQLNLVNSKGEVLPRPQYQVLISYILLEKGIKELYLPVQAPRVIADMAQDFSARVYYTPGVPGEFMEGYINYLNHDINFKPPYFYPYLDGIYGLGLILEKMAKENLSFNQLKNILPEFYMYNAEIPCIQSKKARIMNFLTKEAGQELEMIEGVKFSHHDGWALVIPDSERPVFHIYAEGQDEETAESITGFYLDRVKKLINEDVTGAGEVK